MMGGCGLPGQSHEVHWDRWEWPLIVWLAAFSIVLFCKGRRVLVVVPYHTPIVTCLDASFSLGGWRGWGSAQMPRT